MVSNGRGGPCAQQPLCSQQNQYIFRLFRQFVWSKSCSQWMSDDDMRRFSSPGRQCPSSTMSTFTKFDRHSVRRRIISRIASTERSSLAPSLCAPLSHKTNDTDLRASLPDVGPHMLGIDMFSFSSLRAGGSKGGSLMQFTNNQKLLVKQLSKDDICSILTYAQEYCEHVTSPNPEPHLEPACCFVGVGATMA